MCKVFPRPDACNGIDSADENNSLPINRHLFLQSKNLKKVRIFDPRAGNCTSVSDS